MIAVYFGPRWRARLHPETIWAGHPHKVRAEQSAMDAVGPWAGDDRRWPATFHDSHTAMSHHRFRSISRAMIEYWPRR